jgi:hypothetical protein
MNPLFVVSGQKVESSIDSGMVGQILNLEDGATADYSSSYVDSQAIKLLLDQLLNQLWTIAGVPSSIIGQSNVSNVSEVSLELLFRLAINKARKTEHILRDGFSKRHEYIMQYMGIDNASVDVVFNYDLPSDTKSLMDNMKTQWEMNSISKETIIENSPFTNDVGLELDRIKTNENNSNNDNVRD